MKIYETISKNQNIIFWSFVTIQFLPD